MVKVWFGFKLANGPNTSLLSDATPKAKDAAANNYIICGPRMRHFDSNHAARSNEFQICTANVDVDVSNKPNLKVKKCEV